MTNINFLIEIKQEYTTQLINILTPLIYEGIYSIYFPLIEISCPDNILIDFQQHLQQTPNWSPQKIEEETDRIKTNSKSYMWLEDLIKATLKSYIIVLTYNPSSNEKIDPGSYKNIKIHDFIHKIYIECAREFWNNPYLFYHNYPIIELKRNHRDSISIIKDCIKEALRKLLPLERMLKIYLQEENNNASITEPPNYINGLLQKEKEENYNESNVFVQKMQEEKIQEYEHEREREQEREHEGKMYAQEGGQTFLKPEDEIKYINQSSTESIKNNSINSLSKSDAVKQVFPPNLNSSVGSQILNIINKNIHEKDIKLTDQTSDIKVNKQKFNNLDTETSINKNYNHPEIYSNAINKKKNEVKTVVLNKDKFLSNYLKM
jgi:hypothetical protein